MILFFNLHVSATSLSHCPSYFSQLNHTNLVQLYGIVTKQQPLIIVTELMQYGMYWSKEMPCILPLAHDFKKVDLHVHIIWSSSYL